ncbi:hypothetical protein LDENG_00008120 [Lucifuga dentata]|nr:hypothetical protein LDENG_00008120 [Lucifuga dentata]
MSDSFQLLEENIVMFVKNELKRIQKVLHPDYPECLESQSEDEEVLEDDEEEQRRSSREAFMKMTVHFLRRMKQEELADSLLSTLGSSCGQVFITHEASGFLCSTVSALSLCAVVMVK